MAMVLMLVSTRVVAVQLSSEGVGQVLLFPYYSAQTTGAAPFVTLVSIVNTTPDVKAVRVRFREGRAGVSVGEYNVYLDANDVWTFGVVATVNGPAGIGTFDQSCAYPALPADGGLSPLQVNGLNADTAEAPDARTLEGSIEVIEMGDYGPPSSTPGALTYGVHHPTNLGVSSPPQDCTVVAKDDGKTANAPTGGILGSAMVISILRNVDYFYSATALTHFNDVRSLWSLPSTSTPSLAQASPATSIVHDGDGRLIRSTWSHGIDAVSALFMADAVQGEFVLEVGTVSQTNWVITMPTKWYYVHQGLAPAPPFRGAYQADGACEWLQGNFQAGYTRDREGNVYGNTAAGGTVVFAPVNFSALCFSTQSAGFNGSDVFSAAHTLMSATDPASTTPTAGTIATPYSAGWATIPLDVGIDPLQHSMTAGATTIVNRDGSVQTQAAMTYFGLPVLGFAVSTYDNGTLTDSEGTSVFSKFIAGTALRTPVRVQ